MFHKDYLLKLLLDRKDIDFRALAKLMRVPIKHNKSFSKFLFDLVKKGEIFQTKDRRYFLPKFIGTVEDVIRISPKGFGFVDQEDGTSIFVQSTNTMTAMDGDLVRIKYFSDPQESKGKQGIVEEVISRNKIDFVGRVSKFGNSFGIIPFNKKIQGRFRFSKLDGIKENMEVKVRIIKFESDFNKVEVIKILGMSDDASIDILTAIEDANIPLDFSPNTILESKKIPNVIDGEDFGKRIDLRDRMIYTIDGEDTKDFDDAIDIRKLENGNYILGVHIADVTHYVREDKPIDKEAKNRGTSIYLADRVIPMLPKSLSNGICSLNPNVDRFTITCEMEIDSKGNTISTNLYPSIINSKYRLTYKEVNNYFEGQIIWDDSKLINSLDTAFELSKIIRNYKENEGYIDFEIEESKIIIDKNGKTKDIVPRERSYSEILIEDFMVRANESVSKYISDLKLPFIYRIHDKPDFEKVASLQSVINILGIKVKIPMSPIPREFAKAVNGIKKSRFDDFVKVMMLRTMSKAEYSSSNIGHFGLASKYYTHFTSPIRRYPDLIVHRMIREYLFEGKKNRSAHFESILPDIASHSSSTEQKAVMLERRVADIKKAEYYEKFIGKSFEGTIVSMLKFGFFVEFPNKVGGLVHISSLIDGRYEHINKGLSITNGSRTFTVGDKIDVTVAKANKDEAKIDLVVKDLYENFKKNSLNKFK